MQQEGRRLYPAALPDHMDMLYLYNYNRKDTGRTAPVGRRHPARSTAWPVPSVPWAVVRSTVYQAAVELWSPRF